MYGVRALASLGALHLSTSFSLAPSPNPVPVQLKLCFSVAKKKRLLTPSATFTGLLITHYRGTEAHQGHSREAFYYYNHYNKSNETCKVNLRVIFTPARVRGPGQY